MPRLHVVVAYPARWSAKDSLSATEKSTWKSHWIAKLTIMAKRSLPTLSSLTTPENLSAELNAM